MKDGAVRKHTMIHQSESSVLFLETSSREMRLVGSSCCAVDIAFVVCLGALTWNREIVEPLSFIPSIYQPQEFLLNTC